MAGPSKGRIATVGKNPSSDLVPRPPSPQGRRKGIPYPLPWGEDGGHAPPGLRPPKGYWGAVSNFGFGPQAGEGSCARPPFRNCQTSTASPAKPGDLLTELVRVLGGRVHFGLNLLEVAAGRVRLAFRGMELDIIVEILHGQVVLPIQFQGA